MKLRGKHILISGIGNGIGREIALQLVKIGSTISGVDLYENGLKNLGVELEKQNASHYLQKVDITDPAACATFVENARGKNGLIDVVINCAGITYIDKSTKTSAENYQKVITVNLLGTIYFTQAALPQIIEQQGAIVGVSSIAGFSPLLYRTAYAASKHGVLGYLNSLRSELRHQEVNVMAVCPGYVETTLQKDFSKFENNTGEMMSAKYVAQNIIKGIEQDQETLLIGKTAKFAYWLNRFFPRIYERIMIKKTK